MDIYFLQKLLIQKVISKFGKYTSLLFISIQQETKRKTKNTVYKRLTDI